MNQKRGPKARLGKADDIRHRHQAVVAMVRRPREIPITVTELDEALHGVGAGKLRTLQRDLNSLEEMGYVKRKGNGWIAGRESYVEDLDQLATSVALELMVEAMAWAIPLSVQEDLKKVLINAKRRIEASYSQDPTIRWLQACRFRSAYSEWSRPIIKPDVRDAVETAIVEKRKLRIHYQRFWHLETTDVSVSHYLFQVPDSVEIVIWIPQRDGTDELMLLPLEYIDAAECLDVPATWPADFSVKDFLKNDDLAERGSVSVTVRLAPLTYNRWKRRGIGRHLVVCDTDEQGYVTCRIDHCHPLYVMGDLNASGVEVLAPEYVRRFLQLDKEAQQVVEWNGDGTIGSWNWHDRSAVDSSATE